MHELSRGRLVPLAASESLDAADRRPALQQTGLPPYAADRPAVAGYGASGVGNHFLELDVTRMMIRAILYRIGSWDSNWFSHTLVLNKV